MGEFLDGAQVTYTPTRGAERKGEVAYPPVPIAGERKGWVWVALEGDPFAVQVPKGSLTPCNIGKSRVRSTRKVRKLRNQERQETGKTMPTKTKTKRRGEAKALRAEAKSLGVANPDNLGLDELRTAVRKAHSKAREAPTSRPRTRAGSKVSKAEAAKVRPPSKRSPAKAKPAASKATQATGGENPFRKGSDLHIIAPLLIKGGKRRTLAERLSKKIALHPYSAKKESEVDLTDFDKRLLLAAGTLRRKFGYTEVREGRGLDGTIVVLPPGVSPNGTKARKGKGAKKAAKTKR